MILTFANVAYVLVAVAMIGFILMQRGAGAAAGSGFGAGASATVFGSRGSSNFLSKSTAVLATLFFGLSLGMAVYATKALKSDGVDTDLGVMGTAVPAQEAPAVPSANDSIVPMASDAAAPAAESSATPAAEDIPAEDANAPAAATPTGDDKGG